MLDSDKAAAMAERLADCDPFDLPAPDDAAVAKLRELGMLSVADARWLDQDNEAPPLRALLLVEDSTGPAGSSLVPFMPAGKVAMLVAPGGTGKTQALVQLAVAVAGGLKWLETYTPADPGPVLLVLGEEDNDEIHRRIRCAVGAMSAWHLAPQIAANLHALSVSGKDVGFTDKEAKERDPYKVIRDGLKAWPDAAWRLIIIDPASRFLGPECETDNAAATRWIEAVERLTQLPGRPTVLLAHHTTKGGLAGETDQGAARGSSALTDGCRWQANLDRKHEETTPADRTAKKKAKVIPDLVELHVVKSNHCRPSSALLLKRDIANGGYLKPINDPPRTSTPKAATETPAAKAYRQADAKWQELAKQAKAAQAALTAHDQGKAVAADVAEWTAERKRLADVAEGLVRKAGEAMSDAGVKQAQVPTKGGKADTATKRAGGDDDSRY